MDEVTIEPDQTAADIPGNLPTERDVVMRFESLGGAGHGCEFGLFQRHYGAEPLGLLRWADLAADLLIQALEARFEGVGEPENTVVFKPDSSDEWWTRDTRFWMAMRSFVKVADVTLEQMTVQAQRRLTFLRRKLIEDLGNGEKIFVFKDMRRNLTDGQLGRLHRAIRSYGDSTLLYLRYADERNPAGTVRPAGPGLLIGYVANFTFSPEDRYVGPVHDAFLQLCREALRLRGDPLAAIVPRRPGPPPRLPQGRRRRIVLFGNCQMQAMAGLYQKFVAPRSGDELRHVASYQDLSGSDRKALEDADLIVEQVLDLAPKADADGIAARTPRLFVPLVTAAFLWPFTGPPHPRNTGTAFLPNGPYGADTADSYLNRLILAGQPPEEAVEHYLALDVGKRVNLDRLFELVMARQRSRDEASGYQVADVIERHFRSEQIFLSPYHPNVRIAVSLATRFFQQLGAEPDDIARMQARTRITPFPKGELPIHPAVSRHWGLEWVTPDRRYRFLHEGLFTVREYALRYMRYEWNDALEEGMSLTHARQYTAAAEKLRLGLERSPGSAAGHDALGHVLQRIGSRHDALAASLRAVEIESEDAGFRCNAGVLLRDLGRLAEAEIQMRAATAADPTDPHYRVLLSHILRQRGKPDEAIEALRAAIALDPWAMNLRLDMAGLQEGMGDWAGVVETLRDAAAFDPEGGIGPQLRLAQALSRLGRHEDALSTVHAAIERDPTSVATRITLSECLLRQGRQQDALTQAYLAAISHPDSAEAYAHLGSALRQTGDLAASGQAWRRAVRLSPDNAHYRHEISILYIHMKRLPDAITAARESVEREPQNVNRLTHLAHLYAQAKAWPEAEATLRQACEKAPNAAEHRVALSGLYAREGRLPEALAEAQAAVDLAPADAGALRQLAQIEQRLGHPEQAEQRFRQAVALAPDNAHDWYLLSALCLGMDRLPEAIEAAEMAVTREPGNAHRLAYLADVLTVAGDGARARAALDRAIAMEPAHMPFRITLSNLHIRLGDPDTALVTAREAQRTAPDDPLVLGQLAHVEALLGRRHDAELHLRAALALAPGNEQLQRQFGELVPASAA